MTQQDNQSWEDRFNFGIEKSNFKKLPNDELEDSPRLLLDAQWYPESEYEIDKDRVKQFISEEIEKARNNAIDECMKEVNSSSCVFGDMIYIAKTPTLEKLQSLKSTNDHES